MKIGRFIRSVFQKIPRFDGIFSSGGTDGAEYLVQLVDNIEFERTSNHIQLTKPDKLAPLN
tara:strand:+ start:72 stop:254 length:183 start_codon:yes stop_codon:yes gene_type:complete